ncbi:MAG: hypothetical protein WEB85_05740 [Dongiaceae bacterium]
MSLAVTLVVLALAAAVFALANWRSRRPRPPGEVSLVPWTGVQFLAAVAIVLMLAHLVTLATGRPFAGRYAR